MKKKLSVFTSCISMERFSCESADGENQQSERFDSRLGEYVECDP
jgi:hypothetical protein